jgi:hypothetical protein
VGDPILEKGAVRETCQSVMQSEMTQFLLEGTVLGDISVRQHYPANARMGALIGHGDGEQEITTGGASETDLAPHGATGVLAGFS